MPPDLGRDFDDDEFVYPGGEPALAAELSDLGGDSQQRIGRGLACQIIKLAAADP
jgi:hypothetical protein